VIVVQLIEIPQFPTLRGQDAIEALNEIIRELEEQKSKELTEKQAKALIKFANGLISSIEAEMSSETSNKDKPKHFAFFKKVEDAVLLRLQLLK